MGCQWRDLQPVGSQTRIVPADVIEKPHQRRGTPGTPETCNAGRSNIIFGGARPRHRADKAVLEVGETSSPPPNPAD